MLLLRARSRVFTGARAARMCMSRLPKYFRSYYKLTLTSLYSESIDMKRSLGPFDKTNHLALISGKKEHSLKTKNLTGSAPATNDESQKREQRENGKGVLGRKAILI